ncbi:hypothetical protein ACFSHT_22435 [Paraburkholderia silviterrae]|uniref:Uncharacterized protein n=1 Tax=Paraburkholderia silviterrae TaxID=2528715 RepID=A0A4R5MF34_9BURK|nr:hypothetical protein [Paraburkholderia silviterrae]TDG25861.1 hypothetical protein EYW47_00375 [Paraburkholderia silviterrae]
MTQDKPVILFQVHVMDTDAGHEIPIGPAMDRQEPLEDFCEQTNLAILRKKITGWRDAHIVSFVKETH